MLVTMMSITSEILSALCVPVVLELNVELMSKILLLFGQISALEFLKSVLNSKI